MKLNEKIYAQLANRVYDREDIRNKRGRVCRPATHAVSKP